MTPRERFFAAVEGRPVDRIPVTTWVHFLSDHLGAADTAGLHEKFLKAYGWDYAKVMGDYRYPVPPELRSLDSPALLDRIPAYDADAPHFAVQLACLAALRQAMGPDFPLLDTGFDPYQSILRNIGRDQEAALWTYREATLDALERTCASICAYVRALKKLGVEGFFYSVNSAIPAGQPRGNNDAVYETFLRPFDLRILEEARGMVRVLHVHGTGLAMERVRDYPCEVINLSDRLPGNPSLAQLRTWTDKCLMGGLDETRFADLSLTALAAQVDDAVAQAGREHFLLAPGCTIPSFSPKRSLAFLRAHVATL
ncbi:MAG: hypothetical protein JNM90_25220 [Burkholderiales bacterium]|nr:hypothetical protein [Burkholderiales bacterium]